MASQRNLRQIHVIIEPSTTITAQNKQILVSTENLNLALDFILKRYHAGYFRISLSLGGQTLLWKTLISPATNDDLEINPIGHLLHLLHPACFLVLWFSSLFVLISLCLLYILRCLFYFKMVKAEFLHDVGVNYLFAPWISWLLLLQSAPNFMSSKTVPCLILWWVFTVPVLILDVKLYGQWFTKGKRFLSSIANPTSQISVTGNLISAQVAATMGWKECAICLFSLGMVHYLVLFITLYQRLSGGNSLPAILRPVFFWFFAAPSVACLAWEAIVGAFDAGSKMLFFLSLFLFTSLVCRPSLFKRSMRRFNVAWWDYSFPITVLALASADYAKEVKGVIASLLVLLLSSLSVLVCFVLTLLTVFKNKMLLHDNDPILDLLYRLPLQ